jgi:hypothetical protein
MRSACFPTARLKQRIPGGERTPFFKGTCYEFLANIREFDPWSVSWDHLLAASFANSVHSFAQLRPVGDAPSWRGVPAREEFPLLGSARIRLLLARCSQRNSVLHLRSREV